MYQELFDYMYNEHDLLFMESELQEIVRIVEKMKCPHPGADRRTQVVHSAVNCETTVEYCGRCGQHLTEPETDC